MTYQVGKVLQLNRTSAPLKAEEGRRRKLRVVVSCSFVFRSCEMVTSFCHNQIIHSGTVSSRSWFLSSKTMPFHYQMVKLICISATVVLSEKEEVTHFAENLWGTRLLRNNEKRISRQKWWGEKSLYNYKPAVCYKSWFMLASCAELIGNNLLLTYTYPVTQPYLISES